MNQKNAKPSPSSSLAAAVDATSAAAVKTNEQDRLRQELLRMILKNEAQRKERLRPHLDLNAPRPVAEMRFGS